MAAGKRARLLHLTPHLGGGVGRALVNLVHGDTNVPGIAPERTVLCLEPPEKQGAARALKSLGVAVHTLPFAEDLPSIVAGFDLVQLEAWNHPRMFDALVRLHRTPARVVPWCHVSGLHFPRLPAAFWHQPFPVALTSSCSLQDLDPALQLARQKGQVQVISSAAGFERWPAREATHDGGACRLGYLGTLNASKMHPDYVDWLAATCLQGINVEVLGDEVVPGELARRCAAVGRSDLIRLTGFCHDVPAALARWDVMVYLLNPYHYGTAEIALLEAMASGVVPIVGEHSCELELVRHGWNGWVVQSPEALKVSLMKCQADPDERLRMGRNASTWVRETFTTQRQTSAFRALYSQALSQSKAVVDWPALVGTEPWQWFASTLPDPACYPPDGLPRPPSGLARFAHLEHSKGSVHHFARCFPKDQQLRAWSGALGKSVCELQAKAA